MSFKKEGSIDSHLYSIMRMKILFSFIIALCLLNQFVYASNDDYALSLSPKDCVSLYKGQTCHLTLEFNFTASSINNYCVYRKGEKDSIACWTMQSSGAFSTDFATNKEVIFELRLLDNPEKVLSSVKLNISWVYKVPDKKRAAWRLF